MFDLKNASGVQIQLFCGRRDVFEEPYFPGVKWSGRFMFFNFQWGFVRGRLSVDGGVSFRYCELIFASSFIGEGDIGRDGCR